MSLTDLEIVFSTPKPYYSSKENLDISYNIKNNGERKIYFVKDRQYTTYSSDLTIEIGFALRKPAAILTYYKFSPPQLEEIDVHATKVKDVEIPIPLQKTHVNQNHQIFFEHMPISGKFNLQIVLGYGFDLANIQRKNLLQSFLAWQKLARSPKLEIIVD